MLKKLLASFTVVLIGLNLSFAHIATDHEPVIPENYSISAVTDSVNALTKQLLDIKQEASRIHSEYAVYESDAIIENYEKCSAALESALSLSESLVTELNVLRTVDKQEIEAATLNNVRKKEERFYISCQEVFSAYGKLSAIDNFYSQLEAKKAEWRTEYEMLSAKVISRKEAIDDLFERSTSRNYYYGGMNDVETITIRKKNIYEAYNFVYDAKVEQVQLLPTSDYRAKVALLEDILEVLEAANTIGRTEETRELEKSLRNIENCEEVIKQFNDFLEALPESD